MYVNRELLDKVANCLEICNYLSLVKDRAGPEEK